MKVHVNRYFAAIIVLISMTMVGCAATGPKYPEVVSTLPSLDAAMGRIYFYRPGKFIGGGIQPKVRLNEEVVGKATPGGFFYVDKPPGDFRVALKSETEKALTFTLAAGQTRYVRLTTGLGVVVYRVYPELQDEAQALEELQSLSYTGSSS